MRLCLVIYLYQEEINPVPSGTNQSEFCSPHIGLPRLACFYPNAFAAAIPVIRKALPLLCTSLDGNIMPILDQLVDCHPHALHSIDPQGHVDIAEVKRLVGDKVALIGNVNCAALQTGTDEEVRESVLYALQSGMPGYGYVFSTSNCVYTGMPLKRYDFMLDLWRKYGNYT